MKWKIIEGNTQKLDGGAMFGNAPKELWKKWVSPDELNRIPLATRALLVQTDKGQNILFDAGIGAFFEPKLKERYGVIETQHLLLSNLALEGIVESDIDVVILSHLHFDHAGGLLSACGEGEMRLLFPNATFYVGRAHWQRALQPHLRDRASFIPRLHELLQQSGRLKFIENSTHPDLDFGVEFRFSDGHTIGLMISLIETSDGLLGHISDLIPGVPWVHLPITMGYDRYPELLIEEKKQFFEEFIDRNVQLIFPHDPGIPFALLQQDSEKKHFVKI